MQRHVMVPLDGSRFAEMALPTALRLTESAGSSLELVMVQEVGPVFAVEAWEAAYPEAARSYLDQLTASLEAGDRRVETSVRVGRPVEELEKRAQDGGADFVVMSTHGRGPLSRIWLGSVANELVRHAPAPMVMVRPEEKKDVDLTQRPDLSHVLVPLDGSEHAEGILAPAAALGRDFDARYTLLRVVRYPDELVSAYVPGTIQMSQQVVDEGVRDATTYLDRTVARLRTEGLDADARVVVDSRPASAILCYAEDHAVDLIAMATHGRTGVQRAVMGSVTDKVVRGAHTPVLVVRPK